MDMQITTQSAEEKFFDNAKKETAAAEGVKSQPQKSEESKVEAKVETPESPTEKKEDVKLDTKAETKEETEPEQPETKAEDAPKKKNHNGRRFDELTRDLGFYKTKAEALEAQMRDSRFKPADKQVEVENPSAVPDKAKFEDEASYNLAVLKWHVRQEMEQEKAEARRLQTISDFDKKVNEAKQSYDDYDDVIYAAQHYPLWQYNYPHVTEKIVKSNYGPDLMYYLASNRGEADKVASMDPVSAISYLTEIEGYIKSALNEKKDETPASPGISKKASKAPAPYQTPAGSPAPSSTGKKSIYDKDLTRSDFKVLWAKETGQR